MGVPIEELIKIRTDKVEALKKLGVNTNPPVYSQKNKISEIKNEGKTAVVAGRIRAYRLHGNLCFFDVQDDSDQIQIMVSANEIGKDNYSMVKFLDVGDFVGVSGEVFTTKAGEITIKANSVTFLSKALRPLPDTWFGLKDTEERFRKRYLDILMNQDVKGVFDKRWGVEKAIREFMWGQNYKEVETPVLQNLYGGTNARPFTTHLNALDIDMYLRVAPELYLKRLIVGGYERVFEIARNFRNEGLDLSHQPEFTMMEFYEAYADYHRIMDVTEGLIQSVAEKVNGTLKLKVEDKDVDLSGKWRRITVDEAVKQYLGIDWETISDKEVKDILAKNKFKVPGVYTKNKALFTIFDHLVTDKLIQPTWVIDYPVEVSPLSKTHRSRPGRVERFEGYIGGKEICDGWSEIVSTIEQRERFENEQKNMKAGDEEAQPLDEEFLEALSYGCPPLGGIGIGIDRLVMFLTNTWSIKEVIPFPLMRPAKTKKEIYTYKERKIVAVISNDLPVGLATNALGHLSFAAGHYADESWMGRKFHVDANDETHTGISRYPFIVLEAEKEKVPQIIKLAKKNKELTVVDYPQEMFDTEHDDELNQAISKAKVLNYHAAVLVGPSKLIDELTKGLKLYGQTRRTG